MSTPLEEFAAALDRVLATPSMPSHDELSNSLIARLLVSLDSIAADIATAETSGERHKLIRLQTLVAAELNRISRDQE